MDVTISDTIRHKKAILLTADKVRELQEVLLKYYDRLEYKSKTLNKRYIKFESIDELLNYDNFKDSKLESLEICGYNKNGCSIECDFKVEDSFWITAYNTTCTISYNIKSVDTQKLLVDDINIFFKKITTNYWMISKISLIRIAIPIYLFISIVIQATGVRSNTDIEVRNSIVIAALIAYAMAAIIAYKLLKFIDSKILRNIFAPLIFNWGEEVHTTEFYKSIRNGITWTIIAGLIVSIVAGLVVNSMG